MECVDGLSPPSHVHPDRIIYQRDLPHNRHLILILILIPAKTRRPLLPQELNRQHSPAVQRPSARPPIHHLKFLLEKLHIRKTVVRIPLPIFPIAVLVDPDLGRVQSLLGHYIMDDTNLLRAQVLYHRWWFVVNHWERRCWPVSPECYIRGEFLAVGQMHDVDDVRPEQ